jgi:two-component system, OmpR family, sensor histidine kinase KdpD
MSAINVVSANTRSDARPRSSFRIAFHESGRKTALPWPCLFALAGVAACTWVSFNLGQTLGSAGFLYLLFVVLAAVYGGFWQATLVSVVAVGCLDFFFDDPIFSFTIARPSNWVELGAFEFTALIISQLSNRAHLRETEAIAERRDTARLYQIARRILLFEGPGYPGELVASLIREAFELRRVVLLDSLTNNVFESSDPLPKPDRQQVLQQARDAYLLGSDRFDPDQKTWFCALRLGAKPVGGLALCGTEMSQLIATALASLAAIALERARTLEKQCQAEAARQAEQLRTAVLDALAHKFKTPLTVIRTASSGLPAAGELSELQRDLVSLIDQEARTLNDLASRLVGAPKLDFKEFEPQPEPLLFSRLIKAAIQELSQPADRDRFQVSAPALERPVFADRELILTALAQLIDNALKYSASGSPIDTAIDVQEAAVVLKMRSQGLVVSEADRERIFERFYRAPGAQLCSTGTGLGLSIVKTIAADHKGHVWANGEPDYGTVFSFSLPMVPGGVICEQ